MTYKIYYRSDNGKNYINTINASDQKEAVKILKDRYNDITEIVIIKEI